uniref:Beta-galactosidase n=1 Tax=Moschus moschiferus TaxID=68415 RepID=A0A8C6D8S0_MOSMO
PLGTARVLREAAVGHWSTGSSGGSPGAGPWQFWGPSPYALPWDGLERLVGLQVRDSNFTLGNTPFLILSGTIHYFRVPRNYWKDSLLKLKACGFNTVTTHVPWNLHEPRRGQFQFSGNLDLVAFISLASEVDLWVILCVGPYVGSDLDLGGLPSWLLKDSHMKLRTTYKGFTAAVNHYFDDLIPRIREFQFQEEGPVIAMQMENEYGSYNLDKRYMPYIKNVSAPSFPPSLHTFLTLLIPGANILSSQLECVDALPPQGTSPVMMMVYTARSLDGWGTSRNTLDLQSELFSLNFYMFHGGTNFGFMGGAAFPGYRLPMVTSYDYGALLTEDGDYTPEYLVFQELFCPDAGTRPALQRALGYGHWCRRGPWGSPASWFPLPSLQQPVRSTEPLSMEQLSVNQGSGQSAGYILYETVITRGGVLNSDGHVKDRGQVGGGGGQRVPFSAGKTPPPLQLVCVGQRYKEFLMLRILVENQGRLASGTSMNQERKGLTGNIYLNGSPLRKFKIYSLEMQNKFIQRWPSFLHTEGPAFFLALLRVGSQPTDTFVSLQVCGILPGCVPSKLPSQ